MSAAVAPTRPAAPARLPRLGFLGVGWIGAHRLRAIHAARAGEIVAVADPADDLVARVRGEVPEARHMAGLEALLGAGLDGIVIATPNALHAAQAIAALNAGIAVFCQKPLARDETETRAVVAAARAADRLLAADLSYRHVRGLRGIRERIRSGALGRVFDLELAFHNAYGPDKPWFYDARLSGGGCVLDLGVHLVDLALWLTGAKSARRVHGRAWRAGAPLPVNDPAAVEDFAAAELELDTGAVARLACSWRLHAGRDAIIRVAAHGTEGGAALENINGSFTEFRAEGFRGTARELLAEPPDDWGGRAAVAWASRLAQDPGFDPSIETQAEVARVLDLIRRPPP